MKKLLAFSIAFTLLAAAVFAENGLAISGDVKTGLNVSNLNTSKEGDTDLVAQVKNSDDAGTPGRVRINFVYTKDNFQLKWRTQANGSEGGLVTTLDNVFAYAYAMGDFFDNQFRLSLGKIDGDKPWETGGDEIWGSVETLSGARFEFKPNAVKGLNVGFMLPAVYKSAVKDAAGTVVTKASPFELGEYFSELRFGARYENDAIDARVGFQLDGEGDEAALAQAGAKLVYRLNLKLLDSIIPGFSLWANGLVEGIGTVDGVPDSKFNAQEWLYIKFVKDNLTGAALRLGLQHWGEKHTEKDIYDTEWIPGTVMGIYIKPVVTYKIVDWAELGLTARADLYTYESAYDEAAMFDKITVEPSVKFDLGNGASIKPVYTLGVNMAKSKSVGHKDESRIDHTFELRFVYSF
jgi:hypothetical protein